MARSLTQVIASLPQAEQEAIARQSEQLKREYLALQELRKAMNLTQNEIAERLNIAQEGVSRLERRSDLMISTLRKYIEAMGGQLNIIAQLPNLPPIHISGFSDKAKQPPPE